MKLRKIIFLSLIQLLIFQFASCSRSPESSYRRMLKKYSQGEGGSIPAIGEKFLMAFSELDVAPDKLYFNKNLIMTINGNELDR